MLYIWGGDLWYSQRKKYLSVPGGHEILCRNMGTLNAKTENASLGRFVLTTGLIREYITFLYDERDSIGLPKAFLFASHNEIVHPRVGNLFDILGTDMSEFPVRKNLATLERSISTFLGMNGIIQKFIYDREPSHDAPDWLSADITKENYFPPQCALELMSTLGNKPACWARNLKYPSLIIPGILKNINRDALLLKKNDDGTWLCAAINYVDILSSEENFDVLKYAVPDDTMELANFLKTVL